MILACDLDRTLLPNGEWEDEDSLKRFYDEIKKIPDLTLAYVSGRNLDLLHQAQKKYDLELPDYFLGAVGTEVFIKKGDSLEPDPDWDEYIKNKHPNWNRENIVQKIEELIPRNNNFYIQEEELQNKNKISYYLKNPDTKETLLFKIENYLLSEEIKAEVIYSFDPIKKLGLVDILPSNATKLGALRFLVEKLGKSKEDVIYCGDSGNDLLPIEDGFKSILVKNTPDEIKKQAIEIAEKGNLYISEGKSDLNGYYASGVIEGLRYFGVLE